MSKLIDLFVEWSKGKQRWPLLLALLVPVYFAFLTNYEGLTFPQVFDDTRFQWLSGATIAVALVGYLFLSTRERITFSSTLDFVRRGRRVTITRPLASQRLSYTDDGEPRSVTIAKEVALMVDGLGLRTVVVRQAPDQKVGAGPRDQVAIHGLVSPTGNLLRSVVLLHNTDQALQIVNRLLSNSRSLQPNTDLKGSVPWHRVFDVKSSAVEMYVFELPVAASLGGAERTMLTRIFLRHALMTMLYRDRHDRAPAVARELIDIGALLPSLDLPQVAKVYRTAAMNLVADGSLEDAARAVKVGRKFAPTSSELIAAQCALQQKLGDVGSLLPLLRELEAATSDSALLAWLKADYFMQIHQPDDAITSFERAIALERSEEYRTTLHFTAAFAYAMSDTLSSRDQAKGMIRHLEDAIQLADNPIFHVLKAYGWALRNDEARFEAEWVTAEKQLAGLPASLGEFAATWRARGLLKLRQLSKAADGMLTALGPSGDTDDVSTLLMLAGAALNMAGLAGDPEYLSTAERHAERVIELDPSNGEAYKYRALVYTLRAERLTDPHERARNCDHARDNFLKAIRLGHELPASHAVLARLYDMADDPVNAAKHRRRWMELAPSDPDALAYRALEMFDHDGDIERAKAHIDAIEHASAEIGKVYRLLAATAARVNAPPDVRAAVLRTSSDCLRKAIELGDQTPETHHLLASIRLELTDEAGAIESFRHAVRLRPDSEALLTLADLLYKRGDLKEASDIYEQILALEPNSYTAHDNLAYALFDLGNFESALRHWDSALRTMPDDPDALAGRAAAFHELGRRDEARASYTAAVARNRGFLDERILRAQYRWSDRAVNAVKDYMAEIRTQPTDSSPSP